MAGELFAFITSGAHAASAGATLVVRWASLVPCWCLGMAYLR
jgi:hypothetical protein